MSLSDVYATAGKTQQQGALQAADVERQMLGQATGYLQPYTALGSGAASQLGGALGLPGYSSAGFSQQLNNWPGLQFLQNQGANAMNAYGAASGLQGSGAAMKGITNYGQNLAQTYALQPYLSALQGATNTGARAGEVSGGYTMNAAQNIGQDYMAAANAAAQAGVMGGMASQNQSTGMVNDIFGGIGMGAGALKNLFGAAGPFAGALSSLFGGGGGAAAGGAGITDFLSAGAGALAFLADGGRTMPGQPTVVGERGPEIIVPQQPGYVIPNHQLPKMDETKRLYIDFNNMFDMAA